MQNKICFINKKIEFFLIFPVSLDGFSVVVVFIVKLFSKRHLAAVFCTIGNWKVRIFYGPNKSYLIYWKPVIDESLPIQFFCYIHTPTQVRMSFFSVFYTISNFSKVPCVNPKTVVKLTILMPYTVDSYDIDLSGTPCKLTYVWQKLIEMNGRSQYGKNKEKSKKVETMLLRMTKAFW